MSLPGQLAAGTCEIVTLDRDSSQPRRTIARQTARCACKKGQIAGTTRARPACVDGKRRRSLRGGGHLSLNHPNVNAPFLIFFPEACLTPTLKLVLEHVKKKRSVKFCNIKVLNHVISHRAVTERRVFK